MPRRTPRAHELAIGQPLPCDVYDDRGLLLLRAGALVTSASQLEKLTRQLFADKPPSPSSSQSPPREPARHSALGLVLAARRRLQLLLGAPPDADFPRELLRIAGMVRRACHANAEVALASILLQRDDPYAVRHPVNAAIVCQVAGATMALGAAELTATMAAALTMNIGMFELQQELQAREAPLSDEQHAAVRAHCERGVSLLRERAVTDPLWLHAVRDHHERADGDGYPRGKAGASLARSTQLLSLADIYCARVSGRDYRPPVLPTVAMRWLFQSDGAQADPRLSALFIRALGVHPPGTGVRLRSGSIAVVTHRGAGGHPPRVASITTHDGLRIGRPIRRGDELPVHAISDVVDLDALALEVSMEALWGADATA